MWVFLNGTSEFRKMFPSEKPHKYKIIQIYNKYLKVLVLSPP